MSRSHLTRLALVLAALAFAAPVRAAAAAAPAPDSLGVLLTADPHADSLVDRALARMVGVIPGSDTLVAWDVFRQYPQRTVDRILPTLKPVKRSLWLGAPNMVWRVRVLQRLTGLEFRAATRVKRFTPEEVVALKPDSLRVVRFAGENRDRGVTWTAPMDAQKAIFEKWRQWWANDERKPALPIVKHDDDSKWWY